MSQLKPILLYLPGFDGTLLSPFLQFPELGTIFEVHGMTVDMKDRSTFDELCEKVLQYLLRQDQQRPIYLIGESFGGLLALEVLLKIKEDEQTKLSKIKIQGLALVNPATSFLQSPLAQVGPIVASSSKNFVTYAFGIFQKLVPMFLDEFQMPQLLLILSAKALPSVIDTPQREAYMGRVALSLPSTLKFMPQSTLQWRLHEWLQVGCQRFHSRDGLNRLKITNTRILVVVGEEDKTLPSVSEANRLLSALGDCCEVFVVTGAGHASTCGSRSDLAAEMRSRFSELQTNTTVGSNGRTQMKETAQRRGTGEYFGMEPRYDNQSWFGLSPLLYWSPEHYKKWTRQIDII